MDDITVNIEGTNELIVIGADLCAGIVVGDDTPDTVLCFDGSQNNAVLNICSSTDSLTVNTRTVGPQGPKGEQGIQGRQGPRGRDGPQGPIGRTGATGPRGRTGAPGAAGAPGKDGKDGAPGVVDSEHIYDIIDQKVRPDLQELQDNLKKIPSQITEDFLGELAGDDVDDFTWFAGDDDSTDSFVGSVTKTTTIFDKEYAGQKRTFTMIAQVNDNMAAIRKNQEVMVTENTALAKEVNEWIAQTGENIAYINQSFEAMTTRTDAIAEMVTNLQTTTNNKFGEYDQKITVITNEQQTIVQQITDLTAYVDDSLANVTETVEAIVNEELGTAKTKWGIRTEARNDNLQAITGIQLGSAVSNNGTVQSQIIMITNQLLIANAKDAATRQPFRFDTISGAAYLDTLFVKNASIGSGKFTDWLESDAKVNGVPVLRLNFRTGEIQINGSSNGAGGRLVITNRLIAVYDANGRLRIRLGMW